MKTSRNKKRRNYHLVKNPDREESRISPSIPYRDKLMSLVSNEVARDYCNNKLRTRVQVPLRGYAANLVFLDTSSRSKYEEDNLAHYLEQVKYCKRGNMAEGKRTGLDSDELDRNSGRNCHTGPFISSSSTQHRLSDKKDKLHHAYWQGVSSNEMQVQRAKPAARSSEPKGSVSTFFLEDQFSHKIDTTDSIYSENDEPHEEEKGHAKLQCHISEPTLSTYSKELEYNERQEAETQNSRDLEMQIPPKSFSAVMKETSPKEALLQLRSEIKKSLEEGTKELEQDLYEMQLNRSELKR